MAGVLGRMGPNGAVSGTVSGKNRVEKCRWQLFFTVFVQESSQGINSVSQRVADGSQGWLAGIAVDLPARILQQEEAGQRSCITCQHSKSPTSGTLPLSREELSVN